MSSKVLSLLLVFLGLTELILCYDDNVNIVVEVVPNSLFLTCGEKRYQVENFRMNYFRASEFCRAHGWHLATVDTREQDICLETHIQRLGFGKNHFWLGASDLGREGHFVWESTGRPVTYTHWHENNPNNWCEATNRCENCLGLWYIESKGRAWNDFICQHELNVICEE